MGLNKEKFRKIFPHLSKELEKGITRVTIDSVRMDNDTSEKITSKKYHSYNPDGIDLLRRCNTKEEATEIINFMEKRGEISQEFANKLYDQLNEKGLRSFGNKKREYYYFYHFKKNKS